MSLTRKSLSLVLKEDNVCPEQAELQPEVSLFLTCFTND